MTDLEKSHSHQHCHGHDHGHGHGHDDSSGVDADATGGADDSHRKNDIAHDADKVQRQNVIRRLKIASLLCFTFFLVEVAGGLLSGSLAILSDAADS